MSHELDELLRVLCHLVVYVLAAAIGFALPIVAWLVALELGLF